MKYLKRFIRHSEYEEYIEDNPIFPNVSICKIEKDVHTTKKPKVKALMFVAQETDCVIGYTKYGDANPYMEYSFDGAEWIAWDGTSIEFGENPKIYVKGDNPTGLNSENKFIEFSLTGEQKCYGNIMWLLGENIEEIPCNYCFYRLFNGCGALSMAPELPAMKLTKYCYDYLFGACVNLISCPKLPAIEIEEHCYEGMFSDCYHLKITYDLPAKVMKTGCYAEMYAHCESLENAPKIAAETLAPGCFENMFNGCTSIVESPVLRSKKLVQQCYSGMFYECSSLNKIFIGATDISGLSALTNWVYGVSSLGTFICRDGMEDIFATGTSGIPVGWYIETK